MKTDTKAVQKVAVAISTDLRFDPELNKSVSGDAGEYAVSPNGKLLSLVIRGEVYVKEINKDKSKDNQCLGSCIPRHGHCVGKRFYSFLHVRPRG